MLRERDIDTFVSHSSLGRRRTAAAEQAFAQRQNCVIVATSSLELGLDVGDLDRVIQIDAPGTVSSFLQRMGRTGRRSRTTTRTAFSWQRVTRAFCERPHLLDLWEHGYVEPVNAPAKPYHILAQQLMALVLQERGIGRSEWFAVDRDGPGLLADVGRRALTALVDFMLDTKRILWSDDGILSFAPEGEVDLRA